VNATPAAHTARAHASAIPGTPGAQDFLNSDAFTLPAHGSEVPQARHRLMTLLGRWTVDPELRDDAALILSELFTNALLHTGSSQITCRVLAAPRTLYLSVTDQGQGPTGPQIRHPERALGRPDAENGRGLLLVSALARTWGVATNPGQGRTVWAVLNPSTESFGAC
jgi:serine/threonine-protein kinase RsbW